MSRTSLIRKRIRDLTKNSFLNLLSGSDKELASKERRRDKHRIIMVIVRFDEILVVLEFGHGIVSMDGAYLVTSKPHPERASSVIVIFED